MKRVVVKTHSVTIPTALVGIATISLGVIGGLFSALLGIRASGEFTALRYAEPIGCGYYQAGPCLDSLTRLEAGQLGYTNWKQGSCKLIDFCNDTDERFSMQIAGGYSGCTQDTHAARDACCRDINVDHPSQCREHGCSPGGHTPLVDSGTDCVVPLGFCKDNDGNAIKDCCESISISVGTIHNRNRCEDAGCSLRWAGANPIPFCGVPK